VWGGRRVLAIMLLETPCSDLELEAWSKVAGTPARGEGSWIVSRSCSLSSSASASLSFQPMLSFLVSADPWRPLRSREGP